MITIESYQAWEHQRSVCSLISLLPFSSQFDATSGVHPHSRYHSPLRLEAKISVAKSSPDMEILTFYVLPCPAFNF